jgi:lactoylglutathione lyase
MKTFVSPSVATISIYVHDLAMARRFYTQQLGFRLAKDMGEFGVALEHEGVKVLLLAGGAERPAQYPGGVVIGLSSTDVAQDASRLKAAGASMLVPSPEPFPMGSFIAVADPSGNAVELLQFEER